jgi:hypothetical protein
VVPALRDNLGGLTRQTAMVKPTSPGAPAISVLEGAGDGLRVQFTTRGAHSTSLPAGSRGAYPA